MADSKQSARPLGKNLDENGSYIGKTIWNRGFIAMLVTQFTVAMNDNLFRWLIIPIGKAYFVGNEDGIRTLGAAFLLIPFLLWTSVAGYITDKHSRRNVMIGCKLFELILLAIAVFVIAFGPGIGAASFESGRYITVGLLMLILFVLGSQSAFFSPSKYGSIPELVPKNKLSEANGIISMTTMVACVAGQVLGGYLFFWTSIYEKLGDSSEEVVRGVPGGENWYLTAIFLVGIAGIGFIASFFVPKLKAVAPNAIFPKNIFAQTGRDLKYLLVHKKLFYIAVASGFFWGLAALAVMVIDKYAQEYLLVKQHHITTLAAILSVGIGIGAVVSGLLSKGRIELGLVPLGAFGIAFFLLVLGFTPSMPAGMAEGTGTITSVPYVFAAVFLFFTGLAAGLYDIPLSAYLQRESDPEARGRVIAAYNFISFSLMLVFTAMFYLLAKLFTVFAIPGFAPSLMIWLFCGLMVFIVACILVVKLLPQFTAFIGRIVLDYFYRMEVYGLENIPKEGGALFVANHQSYLDGFIVYCPLEKPVRFVVHSHYLVGFLPNYLADRIRALRVLPGKHVVKTLREAREGLAKGDFVCICAEGGITRTGQVKSFEPGFLAFMKGNENVPIIPVYINGFLGSMFSYWRGSKMKLWPGELKRGRFVAFGKPIYMPQTEDQVRDAVMELGVDSIAKCKKKLLIPPRRMIRYLRNGKNKRIKMADSTGMKLKSKEFLLRVLIAKRVLHNEVLTAGEKNVGLLVPTSVGGAIANAALALDARAAVNLNYTFGQDTLNYCIKQANIKHVIASKKLMERFPDMKLDADIFYMEDLVSKVTTKDKILALIDTYLLPNWILERKLGLHKIKSEDTITIFFTSGSTGDPKGAVISHDNLIENAEAFFGCFRVDENDTFLAMLPLFHAYGYTTNFWPPLLSDCSVAFHFNPLEPKKVGEISRKYNCTIMACTPTFLRNYLRRCPPEDFRGVYTAITGAEKLPNELIDAWEEKFGIRPAEGYGMTELSPVVSANVPETKISEYVPHVRYRGDWQPMIRDGSVGRALANLATKIVDPDTFEPLPVDTPGMLLLKGPYVMQGYYNQPEKTAQVMREGWYVTGDIARIDKDGFIFITGRQSRMSKIGGEMVPHILIEEMIDKIVRSVPDHSIEDDGMMVAVTSLPDEKKGERIIVLMREVPITPEEIVKRMLDEKVAPIWVPALSNFKTVPELPILGTGKLDLRATKRLAEKLFLGDEANNM